MSGPGGAAGPNKFKEEFRRNIALYLVFNLADGMLKLVNKLEGTFARSLVACEVPVDPLAPFSGSMWCGDRLYVIDQGQRLSSNGQGQECFFKVLAMVFVAVFADVVGRKPALVLGLVCVGASALLFIGATMSPTWLAFRLFALGQGLQGAYPAQLLGSIVVSDVSNEKDSDVIVVNRVAGFQFLLVLLVTEVLGVCLTSSDLVDFRLIWLLVAALNAALAASAVAFCRETRSHVTDADDCGGVLAGVQRELKEYSSLLLTNRMLRLNLAMFACFSFASCGAAIDFSWYMSVHNVPQASAAKQFFCMLPIAIFCSGIVESVCKRVGMKVAFVLVTCAIVGADLLYVPLYPFGATVFLLHKYTFCIFSGMHPVIQAIDSRWFDQRLTLKFFSMKHLVEYAVGMVANPTYAALFDAKATSYVGKMSPYLLMLSFRGAQIALLLGPIWRSPGGLPKVLERIQQERAEKAKAAAEEHQAATGHKPGDAKKSD